MDTLRAVRLTFYFVLGLILGGGSAAAFASTTYSAQREYIATAADVVGNPFGSEQDAHDANCAVPGRQGFKRAEGPFGSEPNRQWLTYCFSGPALQYETQSGSVREQNACPYGGSLSQVGGTWQCLNAPACAQGQSRDETGQCVNQCSNTASSGGEDTMMQTDPGTGVAGSVCINGCGHTYGASACVGSGSSITCGVYGPFVPTGQSCQSGTPTVGDPPAPCVFPLAPGTVNGINVCVPAGSTSKKTTTTATKTDPSGNPSTTDQEVTTTCEGDKCTTTTTTGNTGGGVGGGVIGGSGSDAPGDGQNGTTTTQVEQSKTDYCAANPNAATCSSSGSFAGDCSAGFVCTGDAVECAAAKGSWEVACAYRASDGSSLAEQIGAGNDPEGANMPWHASQKGSSDVSGLLNQSNPYGATCMPDIQFSIAGRSGTIPTSEWCTILTWIGNLMLAGALMGAAAIIFKR